MLAANLFEYFTVRPKKKQIDRSGYTLTMVTSATPQPSHDDAQGSAEQSPASCCSGQHVHHGYTDEKARYLARLKRIEGQVRGIHRMLDEDEYCIDIVTQISAATSALRNVAVALMDDHLHHCVTNAVASNSGEGDAKIEEAMAAIQRLMKA